MTPSAGLSNKPHFVLLPGLDGTGRLFAPLLDALGSTVSASVVQYNSQRSFLEYVDAAAEALPLENAVLIAESFSGPVALALAARYPDRMRCIVLCATFARSPLRTLLGAAKFIPTVLFGPNLVQTMMLRYFCFNGDEAPLLASAVFRGSQRAIQGDAISARRPRISRRPPAAPANTCAGTLSAGIGGQNREPTAES